ncbi:unnamed protein product [Rhizophagus irregularis]|uniref:DNA-directed RNA polymerase III subunit n=1 Tax=Rhizophagus irregularis TaxID=588596 RepID=A0A2N1NF97_9GLOM|nr:hypothetical protein RhiirC2_777055 [Rhizophagus irregularis]CAB4398819.1 unnamed protein product [Rhizophagus irregularis]CAB5368500.1 unnamed protein product [Rhizophagus irregularis]
MKTGSRTSFTRPKRGRPKNILFEQSPNELHQTLSNDTPPRIEFQGSISPSEDEQEMLKALFAYKASLKDSLFFITSTPSSRDIQRYTDQFKKKKTQRSLQDVKTDLAYFPQELHIVKDKSIKVTNSIDTNQRKVQSDLNLTFGKLLEQEGREKTKNVEHENENEFEKDSNMEQDLEDEEYEEAADYIENYFDDGDDDAFDDDGGGGEGEAYFD